MKKKSLSMLIALSLVTSTLFSTVAFAATTTPAAVTAVKPASTTVAPPSNYGVTYQTQVQNLGWGYKDANGKWVSNQSNTVADANVTDDYASSSEQIGTTGQSLRVEAFQLSLTGINGATLPSGASLQYQVQVQNEGWMAPKADGILAGTVHKSERVEAIALKLVGLPGYKLQYKAHVQSYGWDANWSDAAGTLGSTGVAPSSFVGTVHESKRVEALDVRIVKTDAENAAEKAAIDAVTTAETSKLQADVDAAKTAVQAVQDTTENKTLTDKINAINVNLQVASVSASNLKEINVTFSKPVDQTTAETTANYALSAGSVSAAKLNGNTVTLTLNAAATQQSSVDVTVANVKDLSGNVITATTKTVSMLDVTVPTVTSATITGPTTLKVTYSEPIDPANVGTYSIDSNTYSVATSAVDAADNHSVDVTLGTVLPAGSHTVNVSNAKDFAGFVASKVDVPFTYATDAIAPTVSLVSASQNQVKIKFSKPITAATQGDISVYHTYNNNATYIGAPVWSADNQTVTVTFASNYLPLGNTTIYVNAGTGTNLLADAWGNTFASTSLTSTIAADTTAPTVVSLTGVDATHVDVKYSKAVVGADLTSNYTLKDSTGAAVAVTGAVVDGTDNTLYHLTTATMNGGSYTLAIANIKDTSIAQNPLAAYSSSFTLKDLIAPTVGAAVTNASDATATKIKLSYSEAMATSGTASVLDANNYLLNGVALPTGTTITSTDNGNNVLFTLPSAQTLAGLNLVIGHVADASGNYVSAMSTTDPVTADSISTINTPLAVSTTKVTFEVYQPLSAIDVSKFTVNGVTPAATASYVNQKVNNGTVDGALVTLTVPSANKWASNATPTIAATAGAFTTTFGTASSVIAATPTVDKTAPTLTTAVLTAPNTITLTYSEPILNSSVSVYTYTVPNNTVTNAVAAGNTVTLTLGTAYTGTDATSSVSQALEIQDANGNKLAPSASVNVTDGQLPTVAAALNYTDTTHVAVVFSENVDATTANNAANYALSGTAAGTGQTVTNAALQADGKTVILTISAPIDTTATNTLTTTVTNVKDAAGNVIGATNTASKTF